MKRQDVIAIPVFREGDWPLLLQEAADAGDLEPTWAEWQAEITRTEDQLDQLRVKYREVLIDLERLAEFCRANRLPNTAEARTLYAESRLGRSR